MKIAIIQSCYEKNIQRLDIYDSNLIWYKCVKENREAIVDLYFNDRD